MIGEGADALSVERAQAVLSDAATVDLLAHVTPRPMPKRGFQRNRRRRDAP